AWAHVCPTSRVLLGISHEPLRRNPYPRAVRELRRHATRWHALKAFVWWRRTMTSAKQLKQKADHCAAIALGTRDQRVRKSRMEAAQSWQRLADLDDWLERQVSPFARPRRRAALRTRKI